jgi:hypothetical protein
MTLEDKHLIFGSEPSAGAENLGELRRKHMGDLGEHLEDRAPKRLGMAIR